MAEYLDIDQLPRPDNAHHSVSNAMAKARLGVKAWTAGGETKGWDVDQAWRTPALPTDIPERKPNGSIPMHTPLMYNGVHGRLTFHCRQQHLAPATVQTRLRAGWSIEDALGTPVTQKPSP